MNDAFAHVAALPGVAEAVESAREAVDRLLGHRVLRRRGPEVSAESALRGARASAELEGAPASLEDVRAGLATDPLVQGALRVSSELGTLAGTWRVAPRQALARLHALAAADGVPAEHLGRPRAATDGTLDPLERPHAATNGMVDSSGQPRTAAAGSVDEQGRPRAATDGMVDPLGQPRTAAAGSVDEQGRPRAATDGTVDPLGLGAPPSPADVAIRLSALSGLLTSPTTAPALVIAAVAHGELLALRPFGWGDGVVARAAFRLTLVDRGFDPKSLAVPEVGYVELVSAYREAIRAYVSGTPEGVAQWVRHCAEAVTLGAREALAVCEAFTRR